jgi:hypothetical protein
MQQKAAAVGCSTFLNMTIQGSLPQGSCAAVALPLTKQNASSSEHNTVVWSTLLKTAWAQWSVYCAQHM